MSTTPKVPRAVDFKVYRPLNSATNQRENAIVSFVGCDKKTREEMVEHLKTHRETVEKHIFSCALRYRARKISASITTIVIDPETGFEDKNTLHVGLRRIPNMKTYSGFTSARLDELIGGILTAPIETSVISVGFKFVECSFDHLPQQPQE